MLFHITKLTERTLYKTSYFYPNINNTLCVYVYQPPYVFTYVILYM